MRPTIIAVVLAVLSLSLSASAEEVIGPNDVAEAVAADVTPEAAPVAVPVVTNLAEGVIVLGVPWWWESVSSSVVSLIGVGLRGLLCYVLYWLLCKFMSDVNAKKVSEALGVGVDYAWEDMGRALKHAAKDRKLSADERAKLRNKAIMHAKTISSATIAKIIETMGDTAVEAKVSSIVEKRKAIAGIGTPSAVSAPAA